MDLEREKDIHVGTSWPYQEMEPNECIVTSDFEIAQGLKIGDRIAFVGDYQELWQMAARLYNTYIKNEEDPEQNPLAFNRTLQY